MAKLGKFWYPRWVRAELDPLSNNLRAVCLIDLPYWPISLAWLLLGRFSLSPVSSLVLEWAWILSSLNNSVTTASHRTIVFDHLLTKPWSNSEISFLINTALSCSTSLETRLKSRSLGILYFCFFSIIMLPTLITYVALPIFENSYDLLQL